MNHVGNDVVDLKTTDAIGKASDRKFIQRVLCCDEQDIVFNSKCPDSMLWAFWAAKETAYKAINKTYPEISSAPRRYPVIIHTGKYSNNIFGNVNTPKGSIAVTISIHEDYIHCIGATNQEVGLDKIFWGVQKIDPTKKWEMVLPSERESVIVRRLAIERMAESLNHNPDDIHIISHHYECGHGSPIVYFKGNEENIDLSLSHDGRFAAYAFLMDASRD